jgi:hypothetical protein
VPFEVLHLALMLLGSRARFECAQVSAAARFRILFARIQPVLAGGKFAYHGLFLTFQMNMQVSAKRAPNHSELAAVMAHRLHIAKTRQKQ